MTVSLISTRCLKHLAADKILFRTLPKTAIFVDFKYVATATFSIYLLLLEILDPSNGFILARTLAYSEY